MVRLQHTCSSTPACVQVQRRKAKAFSAFSKSALKHTSQQQRCQATLQLDQEATTKQSSEGQSIHHFAPTKALQSCTQQQMQM